jgi:hypothetical protein
MINTDHDEAEAGKVYTGTIDDALAQIRAEPEAAPKRKFKITYEMGVGSPDWFYKVYELIDGRWDWRTSEMSEESARQFIDGHTRPVRIIAEIEV